MLIEHCENVERDKGVMNINIKQQQQAPSLPGSVVERVKALLLCSVNSFGEQKHKIMITNAHIILFAAGFMRSPSDDS